METKAPVLPDLIKMENPNLEEHLVTCRRCGHLDSLERFAKSCPNPSCYAIRWWEPAQAEKKFIRKGGNLRRL